MTTSVYIIPSENLTQFEEQVAKLNKRARRLGVPEIEYSAEHAYNEHRVLTGNRAGQDLYIADHEIEFHGDEKLIGEKIDVQYQAEQLKRNFPKLLLTGAVREWLYLVVTGEAPKFAGWKFIATLSPLPCDDSSDAVNIVRTIPNEECPVEYRDRVGECDHCKTQRYRKETFVVKHDDGHHKMVGRSCLKDFLGHTDPHKLASWAEWLCSLQELCGSAEREFWGSRAPSCWSLEHFLEWTSSMIRAHGWMSATRAYEWGGIPTKVNVMYCLEPPMVGTKARAEWEKYTAEHEPTEQDKKKASEAIEWVESLHDNGEELNDYLYNLACIGRSGIVTGSLAGYAASILIAHDKAMEREREEKERLERTPVPVTDERMELTGTVHSTKYVEGHYGAALKMRFVDDRGFVLWGTVPSKLDEEKLLEVGMKISFHAKITPSDDDPTFGFFSRPTKARYLEEVSSV